MLRTSMHCCGHHKRWPAAAICSMHWWCRLSGVLKQSLADSEGPCLALTWTTMKMLFPQVCHRLQVPFYRTKVTSWMASQEEDYRFIILEADPSEDRGWAQICVEQA